jgi:hypothetical protein
LLLVVLFSNTCLSQSSSELNPDWKPYYKDERVEILSRKDDCRQPSKGTNHQNLYLKFRNLTGEKLLVRWNAELFYNGKCLNCESGEGLSKLVILEPGEIREGSCETPSDSPLKIFVKMLDLPVTSELSGFNLKEVTSYILN